MGTMDVSDTELLRLVVRPSNKVRSMSTDFIPPSPSAGLQAGISNPAPGRGSPGGEQVVGGGIAEKFVFFCRRSMVEIIC